MVRVPCRICSSASESTLAVDGHVSFSGASVTFEYAASHRRPARKTVIGVEEFARCFYYRGSHNDTIDLHAVGAGAFGGIPGAEYEAVTLRFARIDREAAERLARHLRQVIAERPLRANTVRVAAR